MRVPLRFQIAVALAFLAGGGSVWLAMRSPSAPPAVTPDAGTGVTLFPVRDAAAGPRIVIDPDSVQLLPDASLRLQLPPGFDAGEP
ncbi:MAG: hypothetical protein QM820_15465 [Minicystis sp.]